MFLCFFAEERLGEIDIFRGRILWKICGAPEIAGCEMEVERYNIHIVDTAMAF